jgi:hypothetical protein
LFDVPPPSLPPLRTASDRADISIRDAALCWLAGWLFGSVLGSIVLQPQRGVEGGRSRAGLVLRCGHAPSGSP